MRYIDSRNRDPIQTVALWMKTFVDLGLDEIRCQTGYYTFEGSSLLLPALRKSAESNSVARFVIGSNRGATLVDHVRMLRNALALPRANASLGVVTFDNALFHPKVYHFRSGTRRSAYVGSSNLTGPGMSGLNIEAGIILDTAEGDSAAVLDDIAAQIDQWFTPDAIGIRPVVTSEDIDALLDSEILAAQKVVLPDEAGEGTEGTDVRGDQAPTGVRLSSLVSVKWKREKQKLRSARIARFGSLNGPLTGLLQRQTEASFHYPQGTHLGHLLSIMYYFATGRQNTAYDDQFIRLTGGLGTGRVAAYRRQVKYKILAAMEIGLLTDIRLEANPANFIPTLTQDGLDLWQLIKPFVPSGVLEIDANEDGTYSSSTPQSARFYNEMINQALSQSTNLRALYTKIMFRTPAVMQMLQYLYFESRSVSVAKTEIYSRFFNYKPVQDFCDEMGIEPATESGAGHRCPFLLNVLESCGVITQSTFEIRLRRLPMSQAMIANETTPIADSERISKTLVKEWSVKAPSLSLDERSSLRDLFGVTFLTDAFPISEIFEIGS